MENEEYYWNGEDSDEIICPYCGETYEPSYEETIIGDELIDCFTEDYQICKCDKCGKKFSLKGYQAGWRYTTETIDGEMTKEEHKRYCLGDDV